MQIQNPRDLIHFVKTPLRSSSEHQSGAYTDVRFALHDRTTAPPFCAFAGTSTITLSDSEDLRNDYILYSEWTNVAGNIREDDVGRGNFYLLYNGNYLKVSQTRTWKRQR